MGNSVGQGSIGISPKAATGGIGPTPTLQQVTTAGNVTTVQSLFNGGIRITQAGTVLKLGITNTDFRTLTASMQLNHGNGDNGFSINRISVNNAGANFGMYKSRSTLASVLGALVDEDQIANIGFAGVAANGTSVGGAGAIQVRCYTVNGAGSGGAGVVPNTAVAGLFDFILTNIAGVSRNYLRIWPNGETVIVSQNVGTVIPRLNGMNFQVYGTAGVQTSLIVGQIANNNASAILQVDSTTQGFLPPRMTDAQRTAIAAPSIGLIVYQTDGVEGLYIFKSAGWTFII